jgi:DNA-binding response OmpR family regulator
MSLDGKRVLVVEDNWLMADEVSALIRQAGATVCGPVPTTSKAFELAKQENLDGAVLDVRLRDGTSAPLAGALRRSKVPFIVVSGFERSGIPRGMRLAPFIAKPLRSATFLALAQQTFTTSRRRGNPAPEVSIPDLARRLREEVLALVGPTEGMVMLEVLARRLQVPWNSLYRAALLAEKEGSVKLRGLSIYLTESGQRECAKTAKPASQGQETARAAT